jgi:hypothetical protein
MFARRQIDEAMFSAAREYQSIYEKAKSLSHVHSVDLTMPPISGITTDRLAGAMHGIEAADQLKRIETALEKRAGEDGVALVRDVLGAGKTIERAAAERGDRERRRVEWWGGMFRRSLKHLAEISGFALPHAYENRRREQARERRREKREAGNDDTRSEGSGPAGASSGVPGRGINGALQQMAI